MFKKDFIRITSIIGILISTFAFLCLANEFLGSTSPLSRFVKIILVIASVAGIVIVQIVHSPKRDE